MEAQAGGYLVDISRLMDEGLDPHYVQSGITEPRVRSDLGLPEQSRGPRDTSFGQVATQNQIELDFTVEGQLRRRAYEETARAYNSAIQNMMDTHGITVEQMAMMSGRDDLFDVDGNINREAVNSVAAKAAGAA